jgi:hypothetical protein
MSLVNSAEENREKNREENLKEIEIKQRTVNRELQNCDLLNKKEDFY